MRPRGPGDCSGCGRGGDGGGDPRFFTASRGGPVGRRPTTPISMLWPLGKRQWKHTRGGRKDCIGTIPHLEENFERALEDHTAGDPMRQEVRWTDLNYEQIADHLAEAGTQLSVPVVKRLLDEHGFVTRKAQKSEAMGSH